MFPSERIVTQLPLTTLWTDQEDLKVVREKYLDKQAIRELLKQTQVEFVIADISKKLKWIPVDQCYEFWKGEIQDYIADNNEKFHLNGYAYIASLWTSRNEQPIILLEKNH